MQGVKPTPLAYKEQRLKGAKNKDQELVLWPSMKMRLHPYVRDHGGASQKFPSVLVSFPSLCPLACLLVVCFEV
jgi:hypothetical protein